MPKLYYREEIDLPFPLKGPRRDGRWHHPSTIMHCVRRTFYEMTGAEADLSTMTALSYDAMGASAEVEKWVRKRYEGAGYICQQQVRVQDESIPMRGSIDFTASKGGVDRPVEVKSLKCDGFKRNAIRPDESYLVQLNCYLHMLGCERGILHIFGKCSSEHITWIVERDGSLWDDVRKRCNIVNAAILTEIPPSREREPKFDAEGKATGDFECRNCPFMRQCFHEGI